MPRRWIRARLARRARLRPSWPRPSGGGERHRRSVAGRAPHRPRMRATAENPLGIGSTKEVWPPTRTQTSRAAGRTSGSSARRIRTSPLGCPPMAVNLGPDDEGFLARDPGSSTERVRVLGEQGIRAIAFGSAGHPAGLARRRRRPPQAGYGSHPGARWLRPDLDRQWCRCRTARGHGVVRVLNTIPAHSPPRPAPR